MSVWFLILWGLHTPAFEGGQYQSEAACERAALYQSVQLRGRDKRLHWRCDMRIVL